MAEPDLLGYQLPDYDGWSIKLSGIHRDRQRRLCASDGLLDNGSTVYSAPIVLSDPNAIATWAAAAASDPGRPAEAILVDALRQLIHPALERVQQSSGSGDTQANRLLVLAEQFELFHHGEIAYARVKHAGHFEVLSIGSTQFRLLLKRMYHHAHHGAPSSQAVQDAIGVLEGKALFDGPEHTVYTRIAEQGGHIYLDLCDTAWQVVKIGPQGWQILDESPVMFRRARGMLPLPRPIGGGSVDLLRPFVNVASDGDFRLITVWLVGALCPDIPYAILVIAGEQGSAKSTAGRLLRLLIDPNQAPLRSPPRDERDLVIAATNGHAVAFDNLSAIQQWLSDALCRLSTGSGFATRALWTNGEEVIFDVRQPVLFTGIVNPATAGDLLDRCIVVDLPTITDTKRRDERELLAQFEAARPMILGALLDALSVALRDRPTIHLDRLPRMADFAMVASAAAPALGWSAEAFMAAYDTNRRQGNELALDASPIVSPLRALLDKNEGAWEGTMSEMLAALDERVPENARKAQSWPKNARALTNAFKRIEPNLRHIGITVERGERKNRGTPITVRQAKPAYDTAREGWQESTRTTVTTVRTGVRTPNLSDGTSDGGVCEPSVPSAYRHSSDHPESAPIRHFSSLGDGSDGSDGCLHALSGLSCPHCGNALDDLPDTDTLVCNSCEWIGDSSSLQGGDDAIPF